MTPTALPIANTHLHLPPNFSAFDTVEAAVGTGAAQGARVLGASNFFDQRVYGRFGAACEAAGIVPLYGIELITAVDDLRAAGTRVNDASNPGRLYLCGKAVDLDDSPGGERAALAGRVREAGMARARLMVERVRAVALERGVPPPPDAEGIVADVAARAGVPDDWVVLQERHVAMAIQGAVWDAVPPSGRAATLARLYGTPPSTTDDPVAVQAEARTRLLKAGGPAFVDESPVPFELGFRLVLAAGGIPTYPVLADGADPVCPFEAPPAVLAHRLLELGIHAAELIPVRNRREVVDEYVAALRDAGIVVLAGTEHNTLGRIPIDPACRGDQPLSPAARAAFWEGTCVIAAHQHRHELGLAGFIGADGVPDPSFPGAAGRIRAYAEAGAALLARRGDAR